MLDHLGIFVHPDKYQDLIKWYLEALAPLGYDKQIEIPNRAVGLGTSKQEAPFWIGAREDNPTTGLHFAFRAKDHETVGKFHEAALKAGGTCNGKPGPRPMYHPNYYGAFVKDPAGNNVEVVDHMPH